MPLCLRRAPALGACLVILAFQLAGVAGSARSVGDGGTTGNAVDAGAHLQARGRELQGFSARIVGGKAAVKGRYPWFVSLKESWGAYCGGALIHPNVVLTAAHCVVGSTTTTVDVARYDMSKTPASDGAETRTIKEIVWHPSYNANTMENDIALLYFTTPSTKTPLPMAVQAAEPPLKNLDYVRVIGFGALKEGGSQATILQEVDVPYLDRTTCKAKYTGQILNTMFCAGPLAGGKDSCQGDSGGPIFIAGSGVGSDTHIGIVSWGDGCARPNKPGVYTNTAYLRTWVDTTMKTKWNIKSCPTCSDAECQYCSSSTNYLCASRPSGYACSLGACDGSGSCQSYPGTCPTCSSCKECSEATNYQCVNKEAGSSCPDGVCDANGTCKTCPASCPTSCQFCNATSNYSCANKEEGASCPNGQCNASGVCKTCPASCPTTCQTCSALTGYQCSNKANGTACTGGTCNESGQCVKVCTVQCIGTCKYCDATTNKKCLNRPLGYLCDGGQCDGWGKCIVPKSCPPCGDCTSCDIVSGKCKIAPQGTACTDGTCNNKGKCIIPCPPEGCPECYQCNDKTAGQCVPKTPGSACPGGTCSILGTCQVTRFMYGPLYWLPAKNSDCAATCKGNKDNSYKAALSSGSAKYFACGYQADTDAQEVWEGTKPKLKPWCMGGYLDDSSTLQGFFTTPFMCGCGDGTEVWGTDVTPVTDPGDSCPDYAVNLSWVCRAWTDYNVWGIGFMAVDDYGTNVCVCDSCGSDGSGTSDTFQLLCTRDERALKTAAGFQRRVRQRPGR